MINNRLLKAIASESVDYTPVWLMRQAGRYLPEYRATREKAGSFLNLCRTPELACEVTLQPLARFDLDAAIIFSDILTVPAAMGMDLYFAEGEGPGFHNPITSSTDIEALIIPKPEEELGYVMEAIRLTKTALNQRVPLIGFAGSPWTIACYMVEGKGKSAFAAIKKMRFAAPELLTVLLEKITASTIAYLAAQAEAGAQVLMLFDSWGGLLDYPDYPIFSLHYMARIIKAVKALHPHIPFILFSKGVSGALEMQMESGCDVIGLDWQSDLNAARKQVAGRVALQGNLDPSALHASPPLLKEKVHQVLQAYGNHPGHIFNLGHGITPDVSPDQVKRLVEYVHAYSHP